MKKRSIIAMALAMVVTLSTVPLAGCGSSEQSKENSNTTVLSVLNYDGGVGSEWLDVVAKKFEEKYKEVSFEDGKKGVTIQISNEKLNGADGVTNNTFDVWFAESVKYLDLISTGQVMDITDMVTESLSEITDGKESGTIEDKLTTEQKAALTASGGKYYVLPHYEVYTGLVYDIDLFDKYGYYFSEDGSFVGVDGAKTVGPDGVRGTNDDGLPSSYEELYALMDQMVVDGVTPFTWTVASENYVNDLFAGLMASYCGKDEFMLNVNFDSKLTGTKARIIKNFTNEGKAEVSSVDINSANGYLMSQSAAKYYAYELMEKIMSNPNYHTKLDKATSHLDVQENYILSSLKNGESPVAMLIEGSYWYNEASEAIKRSENTYKSKAEGRRFGWMPLPVQYEGSVTEGNGKKNTVMETNESFAFINAKCAEDEVLSKLSKLFLQYCYTDEALVDFSVATGIPKGVTYTIPEERLAEVDNYFQQSVLQVKQTADVIYPYSTNEIFLSYQGNFMFLMHSSVWSSTVKGAKYANYYTGNKAGVNARDYFEGAFITKDTWQEKYGQFIK